MYQKKLITLMFLLWFMVGSVAAKELQATLKLRDIRVEKTVDKGGDDVYFNITQYSNLGESKENRVPIYPAHWLSKQVSGIKDLTLWQGVLQDEESIKLVIALSDQELSPFEIDDLIGSAQLTIRNHKGKLIKHWTVPILEEKDEVEMLKKGSPQRYIFKGASSRYDVAFVVE